MTDIYTLAALWFGLALIATLLAIWLRIATAMSEIVVGTAARYDPTSASGVSPPVRNVSIDRLTRS